MNYIFKAILCGLLFNSYLYASSNLFPEWQSGKILLVIDEQAEFSASRDPWHQRAVMKEIQSSIVETDLILFVEYKLESEPFRYSPTTACLKTLTDSYHSVASVSKSEDSGWNSLREFFENTGIPHVTEIKVCGINTDACVQRTVWDLYAYMDVDQISILSNACQTSSIQPAHTLTLLGFKRGAPKIKVLWNH